MGCFGGWDAPISSIGGHFNGRYPPRQFMTSMLGSTWSLVVAVIYGWGGCQVLVSLFPPTLWEPHVLRLLVDIFMLTTDTPPGAHSGANTLVTGGGAVQNCDFQALRTTCSWEDSVLCMRRPPNFELYTPLRRYLRQNRRPSSIRGTGAPVVSLGFSIDFQRRNIFPTWR